MMFVHSRIATDADYRPTEPKHWDHDSHPRDPLSALESTYGPRIRGTLRTQRLTDNARNRQCEFRDPGTRVVTWIYWQEIDDAS